MTIRIKKEEKSTMIDVDRQWPGMDKEIVDRLYENGSSQLPHQNEAAWNRHAECAAEADGYIRKRSRSSDYFGRVRTIVRMIIPNQKERTDEDCGSR